MTTKKRGLGRGLDALLGSHHLTSQEAHDHLQYIAIEQIVPGKYQPRIEFNQEKLEELAKSIKAQGLVQPIVVRYLETTQQYEIIAGERRWRAAQQAKLAEIPTIVRNISDSEALALALIENIQRESLNPLEEAEALEKLSTQFNMTHEEIAKAVGRSRVAVSNIIRLNGLQEAVKTLLRQKKIEMGHARALLALVGLNQIDAANEVVKQNLSVRNTEKLVKKWLSEAESNERTHKKMDPNVLHLQTELSEKLCAKVTISHHNSGKGKLIVQYNSLDELEGIIDHIK